MQLEKTKKICQQVHLGEETFTHNGLYLTRSSWQDKIEFWDDYRDK